MTKYLTGTTVVLTARYYDESSNLIDPDATPTCEVHDSRGRVIQTNLPVSKVTVGSFNADCDTTGWFRGVYTYVFTAFFDGKPDRQASVFELTVS
jgi:hypothetical protein